MSQKSSPLTLVLMVASAAIGGTLQYGYNLAIMNAPTAFIQAFINETFLERWDIQLEGYQVTLVWTIIVSIFSLGGFAGALIAGPMTIRFGRKKCLLLNNVFLMSGALFALTSRAAKSFEMIIISRVLIGINAGISMNVQPMYFGECAPKHLRGAISLSSAVFTAFGVVLGQVVGLREILGSESCWQYLLACNAIPGFIQLLTLPWFPESPRYLLIDRGDKEACMDALRRLRGCEVQSSELDEILQEQAETRGVRPSRPWELFTDRSMRWQLISVIIISSAMQLCGNDSIYFYSSYVFKEAGISDDQIQYFTIGTGTCEFTACIMCNLLVERKGRRFMLTGGFLLMTIWAVVFTVALVFEHSVSWMPYLSVACIFTYILSFGMGPAGVTGVLPTEIFNQTTRPAAYMIAGSMMWLNLFIVGMIFPFLVSGLREYCFVPFGAVCLSSALYIGLFLPETKGKSLSAITREFNKLNFKGQDKLSESQTETQYQLGELYFYAFDIFRESGVPETQMQYLAIGIGATELITVTLCSFLIDGAGRKRLMGYGYLLMGVTMCVLTVMLSMKDMNPQIPYVCIGLIFTVICIYGLGPSGVSMALPADLFLQAWRPSAYVISGTINWLSMFVIGMLFGYIVEALGQFCFLVFVAYSIFSAAFMIYFVPVTKGKTMIEITEDFNKLNYKNRKSDIENTEVATKL